MNVLMVGDVVGPGGCQFLQERLYRLKKEYAIDVTIVNGENSAKGNGITERSARDLLSCGADVLTTGNHCFQRREALGIYEQDTILRPANYPERITISITFLPIIFYFAQFRTIYKP